MRSRLTPNLFIVPTLEPLQRLVLRQRLATGSISRWIARNRLRFGRNRMAARPRVYKSDRERVARNRERLRAQGLVRIEMRVSATTADRIRAEARRRECSTGQVVEHLLSQPARDPVRAQRITIKGETVLLGVWPFGHARKSSDGFVVTLIDDPSRTASGPTLFSAAARLLRTLR